jgi:hypothetical protein
MNKGGELEEAHWVGRGEMKYDVLKLLKKLQEDNTLIFFDLEDERKLFENNALKKLEKLVGDL